MEAKTHEVEVIPPARPGRRRRFSADEKRWFLEESLVPGQSVSSVARRYGLSASGVGPPQKTFLAAQLASQGRHPLKAVAEALGVSRSNLARRMAAPAPGEPRGAYQKADDEWLVPLVRAVTHQRATDGFGIRCWNAERVQVAFSLDSAG